MNDVQMGTTVSAHPPPVSMSTEPTVTFAQLHAAARHQPRTCGCCPLCFRVDENHIAYVACKSKVKHAAALHAVPLPLLELVVPCVHVVFSPPTRFLP